MATNSNETLFLIPARSGSKGVPDKNIRTIGGIPTLGFRIRSIQRSALPGELVCSSDSEQYREVARKWGARTPFERPLELSSDTATSVDVMIHALEWLKREEGREFQFIVLAEPSSPFCTPNDLKIGLHLLRETAADSVVSVRKMEPHPIFSAPLGSEGEYGQLSINLTKLKDLRRQSNGLEPYYTPSGSFYGVRVESLLNSRSIYTETTRAFAVEGFYGLEIDSEHDFELALFAWEKGLVRHELWS